LSEGYECVFGSRFIAGGSVTGSSVTRRFLSKAGTILSNALLGTNLKDMTSGFQGFRREIIGMILEVPIRSSAHFYQTELRYLLRNKKITEIPIHYNAPSPRVSLRSIRNALSTLTYYFLRRITARSVEL
jgi:dolichol-phosphate mannosyltransferase